ncbi:hypothetical protein BCY91_01245 [Pelobium manganitolerans]|uniref:Phosphopeptide-binding protein n=1 Tax=Pelobium manganitolerans TaxID=1842495 RepID=A0A419SBS3_9SPHI|nr:hypothetical protein [Pelobium manganitolerans]RKD20275.1 hypothetical protein BCY91_01245 [Pelobium manganitolerans]
MNLKFTPPVFFAGLIALASLGACTQNNKTANTQDSTDSAKAAMSIEPLTDAEEFPNAKLAITNVKTEKVGADSVKLSYTFNVENYELSKQTMDGHSGECANSEKGQHIHFIMDNKPYEALYKPEHSVTLPLNSEHYLLCFLSRSYHLSVKSPGASVLVHFKIDKDGKYQALDAVKEPMLFYSRPKGEYAGKDTQNVLLDFYVSNATLAADAYKVKVNVGDTTFTVDKWQPYFIKNAPMGNLDLKITLLDASGKELTGDNTSVSRSITLKD